MLKIGLNAHEEGIRSDMLNWKVHAEHSLFQRDVDSFLQLFFHDQGLMFVLNPAHYHNFIRTEDQSIYGASE